MKKVFGIFVVVLAAVLSGCIFETETKPEILPKISVIPQSEENMVIYQNVPTNNNEMFGLQFGSTFKIGAKEYEEYSSKIIATSSVNGIRVNFEYDNLLVEKVNGRMFYWIDNTSSEATSKIRYKLQIFKEKSINGNDIMLMPIEIKIEEKTYSYASLPNFSISELKSFVSTATYSFGFEINASYKSESVYANFRRLLKEKVFDAPREVTGKIYKSAYLLEIDGVNAMLFVDVFPYRDGSKAVIYIQNMIVKANDNVGDKIKEVKERIKKIVLD